MIMKIKVKSILLASTLAFSLGACQTMGNNAPKATMGTVLGGAMGGLAGSQVGGGKGKLAAVGIGAVLGAFMGNSIGASLDELDKIKMQKTSQRSLENMRDNQVASWSNPNSGNSGTVMPVKTYQRASGQYCREYQQTITVGGKQETAFGKACRQPDGAWKVQS